MVIINAKYDKKRIIKKINLTFLRKIRVIFKMQNSLQANRYVV